jgi:hypothetical protein
MTLRTAMLSTLLVLSPNLAWAHPGHAEASVLDLLLEPTTLVVLIGLALGVVLARTRRPERGRAS